MYGLHANLMFAIRWLAHFPAVFRDHLILEDGLKDRLMSYAITAMELVRIVARCPRPPDGACLDWWHGADAIVIPSASRPSRIAAGSAEGGCREEGDVEGMGTGRCMEMGRGRKVWRGRERMSLATRGREGGMRREGWAEWSAATGPHAQIQMVTIVRIHWATKPRRQRVTKWPLQSCIRHITTFSFEHRSVIWGF